LKVPDLKVDTQTLRRAGSALRVVHQEFSAAGELARPDRRVIAHPRLLERLEEFADNWDDRRKDMIDAIEGLADIAVMAAEAYENVETHLVKALEGK
jgi:hypothetical protein